MIHLLLMLPPVLPSLLMPRVRLQLERMVPRQRHRPFYQEVSHVLGAERAVHWVKAVCCDLIDSEPRCGSDEAGAQSASLRDAAQHPSVRAAAAETVNAVLEHI